jgi:hypothetical protein
VGEASGNGNGVKNGRQALQRWLLGLAGTLITAGLLYAGGQVSSQASEASVGVHVLRRDVDVRTAEYIGELRLVRAELERQRQDISEVRRLLELIDARARRQAAR